MYNDYHKAHCIRCLSVCMSAVERNSYGITVSFPKNITLHHRASQDLSTGDQRPTQKRLRQDSPEPITKPTSSTEEAKDGFKKTCKNCGEEFETTNIKKETCSNKCRSAFSKKNKKG